MFLSNGKAQQPVYTFTNSWATMHHQVWTDIVLSYLQKQFSSDTSLEILEIGSFEGQSCIWFLENILHKFAKDSSIKCVDHFKGSNEHSASEVKSLYARFNSNIRAYVSKYNDEKRQVSVIQSDSINALSFLCEPKHFQMVYIDGNHEAMNVFTDAVLAFRLLVDNGIMIFDDYQWTPPEHKENPLLSPRWGIDKFLKLYEDKIEILHKGYQVIVKRK